MASESVELVLSAPAHGGACVGFDSSQEKSPTYFVRGGIPGETVRAEVTSVSRKVRWAEVAEVIESSPNRQPALAEVGADLSHIVPLAQRRWKSDVLADQIRRVGGRGLAEAVKKRYPFGVRVNPLPGDDGDEDPLEGRRTRARFAVMPDGRLAMSKYRSHDLVALEEYPLIDDQFAPVFTDEQWRRRLKGEEYVTLVAPNDSAALVVGKNHIWDLRGELVGPQTQWKVRNTSFRVDARGFWQVHPQAAETLVETVLRQVQPQPGDHLIELYSGAGLFTRFLGEAILPGGRLLTLEGNEQAVADAEANCHGINVSGALEFFVGNVDASAVKDLAQELGNVPSAIILDPPRAGAGKDVVRAVANTGTPKVTLVACDPAAAARDMENLRVEGFSVETMEAWDLFPHTHHFEVVVTMIR